MARTLATMTASENGDSSRMTKEQQEGVKGSTSLPTGARKKRTILQPTEEQGFHGENGSEIVATRTTTNGMVTGG